MQLMFRFSLFPGNKNERQTLEQLSCSELGTWITDNACVYDFIVAWESLATKCPDALTPYKMVLILPSFLEAQNVEFAAVFGSWRLI